MSKKVTKADWEEYQKRKKENEEKKGKATSSSASATKKTTSTKKTTATNPAVKTAVTTKKETPKLSESKYTKPSYITPFSNVAENLKRQKEAQKQAEKHIQNTSKYATGQIDSTVAENIGVNTKAVDNYNQNAKNEAFKNQEKRKLATIDDSTLERLGYDSYGLQKAKEDAKKAEQKTNDFITASRRYNDVQKYMDDGFLKPFAREVYRQDQEKKREDTKFNSNQSTFPYQQRNDLKSEIVDRYQDKVQSYYDLVDGNPEFEDYTKLHNFSNIYDAMNSFFTEKYGKDTAYGKMLTGNAFEEWNDIYNDFKTNKRLSKEASTMNLPQKMINAMTVGGQEAMDNISSYGKVIPQNNYNSIYLNALRKSAKSTPEKLAIGASSAFGGMVPSMTFASMVPGAGLSSSSSALSKLVTPSNVAAVSNFLNESQSTYQDQIRQGASYSEAKLMGDAIGTVNALLEKYLGNIPGMSDGSGGIVSKLGKNQISNIASGIRKSVKNPALRAMLIGGGKTAVSFLDEGMEEYIQDAIAAPVVEAVVKGQLPEFALASPEAIESFVVGGILGGTLNLPSNISETITDAKNAGNIQPYMSKTNDYSAPLQQNAPQNTQNVASAFDVSEKGNTSDIVNGENTNSLTTQNKGNLEGVENYSEETQNLTPRPQVEGILKNRVEGILTPMAQNNVTAPQNNVRQRPEGITDNLYDTGQFMAKTDKTDKKDPLDMNLRQKSVYNITDTGGAIKEEAKRHNDNVLYQMYDNAKNSRTMAENSIVQGQHDINGNRVGEGILEILSPYLDDIENNSADWLDLQKYIYNKLDPERSAQGKSLLRKESKYTQKEMEKIETEHPEYKEIQQKLVKYFSNLLQLQVDSGVRSAESADFFRKTYPNYVPAHRDVGQDVENNINVEDMFGTDVSDLKEVAKGSEKNILPLQEQLLQATFKTYRNATLNQVYNRLADNFFNNPSQSKHIKDVYKKPEHNFEKPKYSAEFLIDGEKYVMEMDEFLYKGMEDLANGMKVPTVEILAKLTHLFKEATTDKNIAFIPKNAVRDAGSVVLFSEHPAQYAKNAGRYLGTTAVSVWKGAKQGIDEGSIKNFVDNFVKGFEGTYTSDAYIDLYFASGVRNSGMIDVDSEANFLSKPKNKGVKKAVKALPNGIERVNWVVENIPRFLEFAASIDAEGDNIRKRIENGEKLTEADREVILRAAYNAAKITANFKTGGKAIRTLNKNGVPYLNATTQGLLQLYRNLADVKITSAKNAEGEAKIASSLLLKAAQYSIPAVLAAVLRNAFKDEEWYKKETEHNKQKYIYFGENFRMLKSEAFVLIDGLGIIFENVFDGKYNDGKEVLKDVWSLIQESAPNPVSSNLLNPFIRVGLSSENPGKTYWGGDIESRELQEIDNVTERYEADTSLIARGISKLIGGAFGYSPVKIENLIDSYGGGPADFLLSASRPTLISDVKGGRFGNAVSTILEPFTKHFVPDKLKATQITSDYYDLQEQLKKDTTSSGEFVNKFFGTYSEDVKNANENYKTVKNSTDAKDFVDNDRRTTLLGIKDEKEGIMKEAIDNVPKYREAAEKVLAKYPDFDYANATEKEKNYIQMQIDKEFGGSEYAIQNLNKETYEKAQENHDAHGLSYDDIYAYLLEKQTLPTDMSNEDEFKHMENWLLNTKDISSIDAKNALGTAYVKETMTLTDEYNYDFTDKNSMDISKMTNTDEAKYYKTKQVFGDVDTKTYNHYKKAYDSGETKEEKMAALRAAGLNESSASVFYGIQSGKKAYKTGVTGTETRLRKEMNFHSSLAKDIVSEYEKVYNSNPEKERQMQINFVRNIVKQLNPEYISYFGGENGTVNAMLKILDDM